MAKRIDVKIEGWGGTRNIPVKEIRAFKKALEGITGAGVGFSVRDQVVQLDSKALPKLEVVVKAQGLRTGWKRPSKHPIFLDRESAERVAQRFLEKDLD